MQYIWFIPTVYMYNCVKCNITIIPASKASDIRIYYFNILLQINSWLNKPCILDIPVYLFIFLSTIEVIADTIHRNKWNMDTPGWVHYSKIETLNWRENNGKRAVLQLSRGSRDRTCWREWRLQSDTSPLICSTHFTWLRTGRALSCVIFFCRGFASLRSQNVPLVCKKLPTLLQVSVAAFWSQSSLTGKK